MQTLTRDIVAHGLANRVLTETQLARLLTGTPQRRYHLVNRAMNAGELLRLRRGSYVLAAPLRDEPAHPFALAQAFDPGSYVSFETALAHHGWIPEAVHLIANVTPGRKSFTCEQPAFGTFAFHPLAIASGYFLEWVDHWRIAEQSMLVAAPIRALTDLVCLRKVAWQGMGWLLEGLRVDAEKLRAVSGEQLASLRLVYKHKRVREFLQALGSELAHD